MSGNVNPEFDQYARSYDGLLEDPIRDSFAQDPLHFHRRKWIVLERLLKRAGVDPKTQRWLDVGCGRGELLDLASSSFARAIGCDPSHGMLVSGARPDVFQQPSPVELPFEDNSADLITAVCVYHHVHGEARSLLTGEIRRVLAPGGLCCIIEHNPWNPVTRAIVKRCPVDVDAELLSAQTGFSLLVSAGFERVCADYFLFLPERLFNRIGSVEGMLSKVPLGGQYALLARSTKSSITLGH
jgi:SAM-dependent methyltransferase